MLIQEARWFGRALAEFSDADLFPMVDVGSGDAEMRSRLQPWIDRYLFHEARRRGQSVRHLDREARAGVDLVGDLLDPEFRARLAAMGFRSVVCCNLLEHVADARAVAASLSTVVSTGGLLFVSCPYRFPYHPDPIDTMLRPDPRELAALFPGTKLRRHEIVVGDRMATFTARGLARRPLHSAAMILRRLSRRSGEDRRVMARAGSSLPWLLRRLEATCVVLVKE